MWMSRRASFRIVLLGLGLSACHSGVAGRYELDLEQTKVCVAKAAVGNSNVWDSAITLLEQTRVDIVLDPTGKMTSTISLTAPGSPAPHVSAGHWKLDGKRVLIKMADVADTLCDVDGQRLRCQKPTPGTLFSNYVLVRK
jgi:hypothetical protein